MTLFHVITFRVFQFSFFLVKERSHHEVHVILEDIEHQLQENILHHFLHYSFYEIFIKLRNIFNPLKTIYGKLLRHCPII